LSPESLLSEQYRVNAHNHYTRRAINTHDVHRCNDCGSDTKQPFECDHCDQRFCSDHRLPENHDCPLFSTDDDISNFGGGGPGT